MQIFAKTILISILVSVCLLLFTNLMFFFPWYMTLVIETFNLSQIAASDNYVKHTYYYDIERRLEDKPIFREKADKIEIIVLNKDHATAVGSDDETYYFSRSEIEKPYRQRGEPVNVEIRAVYPLSINLWDDERLEREIPVSFSLETIGLKHYKDLEY